MRAITMLASAVLLAGSGLGFAAERTGDNEHPIKRTALAEADCEIAIKDGVAVLEKMHTSQSGESIRVDAGQALQRYEKAIGREGAKAEDLRDLALLDLLDHERQAKSEAWTEDEKNINRMVEQAGKLEQQFQNLQATFQNANQMLETLKRTDLNMELLVPIYVDITAQARKVAAEYKQVVGGLEVFQKKWEAIAIDAKAKY